MSRRTRKPEIASAEPHQRAVAPAIAALEEGPAPLSLGASISSPPRASSKLSIVLGLLQAPEGASLAKLVAVTGWQPHTTRAALTGLRKRGYLITTDKTVGADGANRAVYRSAGQPQ
jgi:hypothetical protein